MTQEQKIKDRICSSLDIEPETLDWFLDVADSIAESQHDPEKGMSKIDFCYAARHSALVDLFRQAIRYERRHEAERLDSLLDEPSVDDDPSSEASKIEFAESLSVAERAILFMLEAGHTELYSSLTLGIPLRTVERIVAKLRSHSDRFLGS